MEDNKITNIEDKYIYLEKLCGNSGIYADFRKHGAREDEDLDDKELENFANLWKFVKEVETKENGISPDLDIGFELTDAEVMIIMYLKIFSTWMFKNVKRRSRFWTRRRNRFKRKRNK